MAETAPSLHKVATPAPTVGRPRIGRTALASLRANMLPTQMPQTDYMGADSALVGGKVLVARNQSDIDTMLERWASMGAQPIAFDLECAASMSVKNGSGLHPHLGTIRLGQFGVKDGGDGHAEALVINFWNNNPQAALDLISNPDWPVRVHYTQMEIPWMAYRFGMDFTENLVDTHAAAKANYARLLFNIEGHEKAVAAMSHLRATILQRGHEFTQVEIDEALARAESNLAAFPPVELPYWYGQLEEDIARQADGKIYRWALGITCERVLGIELDKTQQTSHWAARLLTADQELYAGLDVLAPHDIEPHITQFLTEEDWLAHDDKIQRKTEKCLGPDAVIKGDEGPTLVSMAGACISTDELRQLKESLPQARLHYTSQEAVDQALVAAANNLAAGNVPEPFVPTVAEMVQPF